MTRSLVALVVTCLAWLWLVAQVNAQTVEVVGSTLSVGTNPSTPSGTSVRLDNLGTAGGTTVVFTDTDGDLFERVLAASDIPSAFTRRDVAEAISQAWTFNGGVLVSSIRGTASPLAVRNTANTRDLVQFTDGGLVRILDDNSTNAYLDWNATAAPSGKRYWRAGNFGGDLAVQGVTDAYSAAADLFRGIQASGVPNQFQFGATVQNVTPATPLFTNLGSNLYPFATLHVGELRASAFVVNETQTYTEASLKVGRGSTLSRDFSAANPWMATKTKFTRYQDYLILRGLSATGAPQYEIVYVNGAAVADCTGTVSPLPSVCGGVDGDDYVFQVARNQDGSGANDWPKGAAVVSTDRWLDIFSESSGFVSWGNAVLGDRPVAYWNFDDGSPTTPNRAGGALGGTTRTGLTYAAGIMGTCGSSWTASDAGPGGGCGAWYPLVNGANYITSGGAVSVPELNTTSMAYAWTIEMIWYSGEGGAGTGYAQQPVARWDGTIANANFALYFFGDAAGSADGQFGAYGVCDGTWYNLTGTTPLANATWYHLVLTWDSYSGGAVYVNGTRAASAVSPSQGCALNYTTGVLSLLSNRNTGTSYGNHFSELAIYDYALAADQVTAHYNAKWVSRPATSYGPSAVGWVRTGTNWYDQAPRWAIGNLQGLYGYGVETFGFAAGNPSTTWISADPDSGFRIMSGTTAKFWADTTGNLALAGNLTLTTGGNILSAGNYQITPSTGLQVARGSTAGSGAESARAIQTVATLGGSAIFSLWTDSGNQTRLQPHTGSITIGDWSLSSFDDVSTSVNIYNNGSTSVVGSLGSSGISFTSGGILFKANASVPTSTHTYIRPEVDNNMSIGHPSWRWRNVHINLPQNTGTPAYVVVNNPSDNTSLGYFSAGLTGSWWVRNQTNTGNCYFSFWAGLMVQSTCP